MVGDCPTPGAAGCKDGAWPVLRAGTLLLWKITVKGAPPVASLRDGASATLEQ